MHLNVCCQQVCNALLYRMTLVHGNNDVIVLGRAIFIKAVVHRRPAAVYVHLRLLYFIKHQ